ncbi:MAG: hypothetical protein WKF77_28575 [Planctomycetaceae bacterium]
MLISTITFGLAAVAIRIDPYTGEDDGTVGTKIITVPMAMLGLPFLAGMAVAEVLTQTHQRLFSILCGAVCHYFFYLLITIAVMHKSYKHGRDAP